MMHLIRNGYSTMRQMIWGPESVSKKDEVPESFSKNGEVDQVFKKYISHALANAMQDGSDHTLDLQRMKSIVRHDPLFTNDWDEMSGEQKLYLVQEFNELCNFHGAKDEGEGAKTIMRELVPRFHRKLSADQVRRLVDLCWQNSPCDYLHYREEGMKFSGDGEKYAASKELDAFTKCIENTPSLAKYYVDRFPEGTIQKTFSLDERTDLFKKSVSFLCCSKEYSEKTRKEEKEIAKRHAQAWSPDRAVFDPQLPIWQRCGYTQADLNEIQKKL